MTKIYFYCCDLNTPSGGIKVLYRHVDILNKHGFAAFILHQNPGFRCTWFENTTPILTARETRIGPDDYFVIPEEFLSEANKAVRGVRKVVFNQNCYYTFSDGYSLNKLDIVPTYQDEEVIAAIVVSEDSNKYLSYVFPALKIHTIRNAIDPGIFFYEEHKKPLISFMLRKRQCQVFSVNSRQGFILNGYHESNYAAIL